MKTDYILIIFGLLMILSRSSKQQTIPDPSVCPIAEANKAEQKRLQIEKTKNMTRLLDAVLTNYDKNIRPNPSAVTEVQISISVQAMGPISEDAQTMTIDCYFRQLWKDERLMFTSAEHNTLSLGMSMLSGIWKPDTYFWNEQSAYLHDLTVPNRLVRLSADGSILYSSRLTITSLCSMHLMYFPMDVQKCSLTIGSFGYRATELNYTWVKVTVEGSDMAQFFVKDKYTLSEVKTLATHNFSTLTLEFLLERRLGFYMMNFFFPSTLILSLSWISFWLPREATADRLGLGVTTVLTMTFYSMDARSSLPKISYPTALDVYLLICFFMLFLCIFECTLVHMNTKYSTGFVCIIGFGRFTRKAVSYGSSVDKNTGSASKKCSQHFDDLMKHKLQYVYVVRGDDETNYMEKERVELLKKNNMLPHMVKARSKSYLSDYYPRHNLHTTTFDHVNSFVRRKWKSWKKAGKKNDPDNTEINSTSQLDRMSRMIFPIIYGVIMYTYWKVYISMHDLTAGD